MQYHSIIGPPASGKTAGRKLLAEMLNADQIVTSDCIKDRMNTDPKFHAEADAYIALGSLLPDEMVIDVVFEAIHTCKKNVVIDGFPRTKRQAEWLKDYTDSTAVDWSVTLLEVSDDNCRMRNQTRRDEEIAKLGDGSSDLRKDYAVMTERLMIYNQHIGAIIDFFDENNICHSIIDGNRPKEAVLRSITELTSLICQ